MGAEEAETTTDDIQLGKSCTITVFKRFKDAPRLKDKIDVNLGDYQKQEGTINMVSFSTLIEVEKHLRKQGAFGIRMLERGDVITLFYGDAQENVTSLLYTSKKHIEHLAQTQMLHIVDGVRDARFIILDVPLLTETERLIRGLEDAK